MPDYCPGPGFHLSKEQAQRYGARIEEMTRQRGGILTPEEVVADAATLDSPLHDYFEWEERVAAHRFRIEQAKYLLRAIYVHLDMPEGPPQNLRSTASVVTYRDGEHVRAYSLMEQVLAEPELRAQVLANALREARAWSARYYQYQELGPVFAAITGVAAALEQQGQPELRLAA